MKKLTLTLMVMLLVTPFVVSQEKLVIDTDRDVYVGGEDLWLTIINLDKDQPSISKVVYVELINKENVPVIQEKMFLNNHMVSSRVTIPDTISTGNYFLRAYTSWMTNYPAQCFAKRIVSIVNPFADNALKNLQLKDGILKSTNDQQTLVDLYGFKGSYKTRQKVSIDLNYKYDWEYAAVSVARSGLNMADCKKDISVNEEYKISADLRLPEPKGEIISGTISSTLNSEPVINEKMMISFVDETTILKFSTTDSTGRFNFEVNRFGEEEMVIQPFSQDTSKLNYKVTLDEQFSTDYSDVNIPELVLDSAKLKEINSAIVSMQINTIYADYTPDMAIADSIEKREAFYGKPERTTIIDKYIELPTTEEVVRELVPFASLRRKKGKYVFRVFEDNSIYPKEGSTMAFVDGVPIYDVDRILNITPAYLDKVNLLNLDYYLQDERLGRLLMFYTKDGDMGDMDFDQRIFRQAHKGCLYFYHYNSPDYTDAVNTESRSADFRNLLYYSADPINDNKQQTIEFTTGDDKATYELVITGYKANGQAERIVKTFVVE
ncbi:MAG: hypothetical protein N4A71_15865 [Carboxylicivirga sp.]|jgi:hypothetical protein|nr:hypothetical protein [Carboxylicivirga sp.]